MSDTIESILSRISSDDRLYLTGILTEPTGELHLDKI